MYRSKRRDSGELLLFTVTIYPYHNGIIAQLVEHCTEDAGVLGSIPSNTTKGISV